MLGGSLPLSSGLFIPACTDRCIEVFERRETMSEDIIELRVTPQERSLIVKALETHRDYLRRFGVSIKEAECDALLEKVLDRQSDDLTKSPPDSID